MSPKTVEAAKRWAEEYAEELDAERKSCDDEAVQMLNRIAPKKSKELWDSGCWMQAELRSLGASQEVIQQIQFAAGQRAFAGDAWQVSVDYVNEYAATGDTAEKGGAELADKINREMFG